MATSLFVLSTVASGFAESSFIANASVGSVAAFAATYWLHSTLLLGAAWMLIRIAKPDSHFIRERIWKLAATAGLATATVQLATGLGFSLVAGPEAIPDATGSAVEQHRSDAAESEITPAEVGQHLTTSLKLVKDSLSHLGERLPESKWPRENVAATSPRRATTVSSDAQPTVTFMPLDDGASMIAAAANSDVSLSVSSRGDTGPWSGGTTAAAATHAAVGAHRRLQALASWMLIGWCSLSLLYLAWQSLQFRWQMRHVSEAAPSHRRLLDSICESRGVNGRVRLLKSDRFEEPVAYGLFRPTILIPAQVEKRLNRDELAALLSHELAHLRRGDILWLVIGRVLTTCFAFQPLNFSARRRWQEHAEFQCDDWAVDRNVDRLTLARSLTLVAEWQAGRKSCAGVVSAGGSRFHISDRVERLVADAVPDVWRRRSRRLAIHVAALLFAGAMVVFGPQTGRAERKFENAKPATATIETEAAVGTRLPSDADEENTPDTIPADEIRALVREAAGLSGDVSEFLSELRTIEPLLAELEQRPQLADQVSRLRARISQLRRAAAVRSRQPVDASRNTEY